VVLPGTALYPASSFDADANSACQRTRRVLEGEKVRLTYDPMHEAIRHRDPQGRLLVYVSRSRDQLDINAELIKRGYATVSDEFPSSRMEEFRGYERAAKEKRIGIWATTPTK
jgi:endonuclease YncB( thermonuclease family)